jgi:uncharacterized membrane protein YcaP (DUF421 family)
MPYYSKGAVPPLWPGAKSAMEYVLRLVMIGVSLYVTFLAFGRISGPQRLSSTQPYDWVLLVAFGGLFAASLTQRHLTLFECVSALLFLLILDHAAGALAVRWPFFRGTILNRPLLLYTKRDGYLFDAMLRAHIHQEDIISAARKADVRSLHQVEAVILEPNGTLSVIKEP